MEAYALHRAKKPLQRYIVTNYNRGNLAVGCHRLRIHNSYVAIENSRTHHAIPVHPQCKKLVSTPQVARHWNPGFNVFNCPNRIASGDSTDQGRQHN